MRARIEAAVRPYIEAAVRPYQEQQSAAGGQGIAGGLRQDGCPVLVLAEERLPGQIRADRTSPPMNGATTPWLCRPVR
ncbi:MULTISPECIES: hypothetical protein [Streptomyces]|uniref:hypothetical protein n=1 Tax=Streptomyces TaxID=1883 RepID=UPI0015C4EA76|nr:MULTISPECIES: hypothetical protein [Streptomyces]